MFLKRALPDALLELLHHAIKIGIARAKAPGQPVSTAVNHRFAIGQDLKLAGLSRCDHGFNAEPLFDQGRETRGLGLVARSSRAGTYLNLHFVSNPVRSGCLTPGTGALARYLIQASISVDPRKSAVNLSPFAFCHSPCLIGLPILAIFGTFGDCGNFPTLPLPSPP